MIKTAVFPVAGKGSRLLPATQSVPKELLPVYNTPLLQFAIDEARDAGIERLVFVTHDDKPAIRDYVEKACEGLDVQFVTQAEPLGLGHAVLMAKDAVENEPFVVILPDDLIIATTSVMAQMCRAYDPFLAPHMVAAMPVRPEETASYGILDADLPALGRHMPVRRLVEKPDPADAPSTLAMVGRYILHPSIFEMLMTAAPGAGGEIQLTDAIQRDLLLRRAAAFRFDGVRFDCGHHDGLLEASNAMRDVQELMGSGAAA